MGVLKTVRNVLISVIVLLAIFVGAGVAYVKFTGDDVPKEPKKAPESNVQSYAIPKPRKPNPNGPVGVSLESLISPVKAGANSSITVKTNVGANCTITVTYNNVASKDSGLSPKTTDDYGRVTWSWTVDKSAPAGKWPVKVTCKNQSRSGMVVGDLEVTR